MSTTTATEGMTCPTCDGNGSDWDFNSPVCGTCMGAGVVDGPRGWALKLVRAAANPAAIRAERTAGSGSGRVERAPIPNLYGGSCVVCRGWVEANAGQRIRTGDGAWVTKHLGSCAAAKAAAPAAPVTAPVRRNSYAAVCADCAATVPAGEGSLTKEDGRWVVRHVECPVQHRAAEWSQTPAPVAERADVQAILADVPAGRYALPCKTGTNDLDFWVVTVNQGRVDPSKKGRKWVARFVGGQGKVSIHRNEVVVVARLLAALTPDEREQAAMRFGQQVGVCGRCGRDLTDEHSRAVGLGPTCEGKAW